jgi:hypothetical protein
MFGLGESSRGLRSHPWCAEPKNDVKGNLAMKNEVGYVYFFT